LDHVLGEGAADCRDKKQNRRDEHEAFPADPVADNPGEPGAEHAADEDDTHRPALLERSQGELVLEVAGGPGDDGRIESEEKPADGGDDGHKDDIGLFAFHAFLFSRAGPAHHSSRGRVFFEYVKKGK
jgi:hypothetical protein